MSTGRRIFMTTVAIAGGAATLATLDRLAAQDRPSRSVRHERRERGGREGGAERELPVTANEDLMREHGAIERVLAVWADAAHRLRTDAVLDVRALEQSVTLVQRFVHDYHERIEEEHVFPRLERAGRDRELVQTLRAQHDAARRVTQQIAAGLASPQRMEPEPRARIADGLESVVRMYRAHAPREDTIVFPAFQEIAGAEYAELGERFEEEEHARLGESGFRGVLREIAQYERAFGLDDLARFTPR